VGRREAREEGRDRQWRGGDRGGTVVVVVGMLERHMCSRQRIG
jgi:hypothetical protein